MRGPRGEEFGFTGKFFSARLSPVGFLRLTGVRSGAGLNPGAKVLDLKARLR